MIIHRFFAREVLKTSSAVAAILFSIFTVTRIISFLRKAVEGDIALDSIFLLLLLKIIATLDILIPMVVFVSMLLVLGRWVRDNEMTAITACGISLRQFLPALFTLFLIIGSMVALFSLYLAPLSERVIRSIAEEFRSRSEISGIETGVFNETKNGLGVYFIKKHDKSSDTYRDIFIYGLNQQKDSIVMADSGYKTIDDDSKEDFLVLKNGTQYHGNAGEKEYTIVKFKKYGIRINKRTHNNLNLPVKAIPTIQLMQLNHRTAVAELHWRLSNVFIIPVLLLFALCFSAINHRKKRFPGMIHAFLIYFTYLNLLGLTMALIRRGLIPTQFSLWAVHFFFLGLAIYLFSRRVRNLRLIPGLPT